MSETTNSFLNATLTDSSLDGTTNITGTTNIEGTLQIAPGTVITGLYKRYVGLGLVDNTRDIDKPISTAVQTALNNVLGNSAVLATKPTLDTLSELAEAVSNSATKSYVDSTKANILNPSLSGNVSIIDKTLITQTRQKSVGRSGGDKATAISSNGQYQLVAKNGIIYVSSDFGVNFVQTTFTLNTFAPNTACMSSDGSIMIVSNVSGFAKKSTNFGATWTDMNNVSGYRNIAMSSDGTKILCSKSNESMLSSNSGSTFSTIPGISISGDGVGMSGNGQYMIIRGANSYISTNGGSTWSQITSVQLGGGHRPNVAISFTGRYMLATENPTSTNNYFSSDFGATWTTRDITPASASTETKEAMSAYRAAMSSDGKFMVIAGNREKYFYSSDFGATFVQSTIGSNPGYTESVSISNDGRYILTCDNGGFYVDLNNIALLTPSLNISSMGAGVVHSDASGSLTSSLIIASDISNSAITTDKIANGAITGAKIATGTIGLSQLSTTVLSPLAPSNNPVFTGIVTLPTTAGILKSNVSGIVSTDGIKTADIFDGAITSAKIADGAIVTVDISNSAVTTDKISNSAVTSDKIADGAITTAKIADGAVVTIDISNSAVTTAKIADSAVTATKIADSAVTTTKIADGVVTTAKLDATVLTPYAPKASPVFTGSVTLPAPTDASGNQAATTSFVMNKIYDVSNNKFSILNVTIGAVIPTAGAMVFSRVDQKLYVCAQDASGNASWFDVGAAKV